MTRVDLCTAIAGLARTMARSHDLHVELSPAFLLLAEALVEVGVPRQMGKQQRIERLAEIELSLLERTPGDRMDAVMSELGIGRSRYYELRAAAIDQRLLVESGESGIPDDCRTAAEVA